MTFCFCISAKIGSSYFGIRTFTEEMPLSPFRVPLLSDQQSSNSNYKILEIWKIKFPFGFSSRLLFLLWCVCGGFLLHFLECNFLSILLKPNYEKPIDTANDILDRGFKIFVGPASLPMVLDQKNSPSYTMRKLAENTIIAKVNMIFFLSKLNN